MKSLLALSTVALVAAGLAGCGGAGTNNGSSTTTQLASRTATTASVPPGGYLEVDGDKDDDDTSHPTSRLDDDRPLLEQYGNEAARADEQAVAAVIKSYYAAAAAEEGAKACALLSPSLATGLAPASGQATCADGVSPLYKQQHAQLVADDVATMVVSKVRVKGNLGLAVLGFRAKPEGEILVERERGAWKVDALFDSQMP